MYWEWDRDNRVSDWLCHVKVVLLGPGIHAPTGGHYWTLLDTLRWRWRLTSWHWRCLRLPGVCWPRKQGNNGLPSGLRPRVTCVASWPIKLLCYKVNVFAHWQSIIYQIIYQAGTVVVIIRASPTVILWTLINNILSLKWSLGFRDTFVTDKLTPAHWSEPEQWTVAVLGYICLMSVSTGALFGNNSQLLFSVVLIIQACISCRRNFALFNAV